MVRATIGTNHDISLPNYAYMNPADMTLLGIVEDDLVRIASPHAELVGVVAAAPDVRQGVISMAHSWGSSTGTDEKVRDIGAPTNRLIDVENGYCSITGQAIQSAIPVSVEAVSAADLETLGANNG